MRKSDERRQKQALNKLEELSKRVQGQANRLTGEPVQHQTLLARLRLERNLEDGDGSSTRSLLE